MTYQTHHRIAYRTPIRGDEWAGCPAGMPVSSDGTKAPLAGFGLRGVIVSEEGGMGLRTNKAGPGVQ